MLLPQRQVVGLGRHVRRRQGLVSLSFVNSFFAFCSRREFMRDSSNTGLMASEGPTQSTQPWPLNKIEEFIPSFKSQCDAYVDQFSNTVKGNIKLVEEHPLEAAGVATIAGLVLMRAPRLFLIRNTLGRLKTEKDLLNESESRMKQLQKSLEDLKKSNSGILKKTEFGEEDILRGTSNMRSSGKQIQSLVNSIHKAESSAADLMHRLRSLPGRESIELRAEVASMVSDLKNQRRELEQRIFKISELGVRV